MIFISKRWELVKCVFLTILMLTFILSSCGQKETAPTWQKQYDLGMRYLSEGNYEEAIITFTSAIEINPKHAETYIHLSEAYEANDYLEDAISTLELGLDITGDKSFLELIETFLDKHNQLLLTAEIVKIDDFKTNGVPINDCTIENGKANRARGQKHRSQYNALG